MRITGLQIANAATEQKVGLCTRAFALEVDDPQYLGYDHVCALVAIEPGTSVYERVVSVQKKIATDPYYAGFQLGWDGGIEPPNEFVREGFEDGKKAFKFFNFRTVGRRNMCDIPR